MARELIYRITDPNYTIYHRAALGGLAATLAAWRQPDGIRASFDRDCVRISWGDDLTDQEAVRRLLAASFPDTDQATRLIVLPGHRIAEDRHGLRVAIHNALCQTFLQHPKMRPGEAGARQYEVRSADEDQGVRISYKGVLSYAHQRAQGTGILEYKPARGEAPGAWPRIASIPQSIMPGATGGAMSLNAPTEDVLLLLHLMIGCQVFLLRSFSSEDKARACIVVPDVRDLVDYARAMAELVTASAESWRSNTFYGRVVGGAEEAAFRFLIDLSEIAEESSVAGCQAIAMGKVAWDKNQLNRSISVRLRGPSHYKELAVFQAANQYLGRARSIPLKDGGSLVVPGSPVPELVAANLAAEPARSWCTHFDTLVAKKKDFQNLQRFAREGLTMMKTEIHDEDDRAVIDAYHAAWRSKMWQLGRRARNEGANFGRLCDVERERIRNDFLRAKTAEDLTGRFLRLCAEASEGRSLKALRDEQERLRKFYFNQRNFERFRNLLLFAMLTYKAQQGEEADEAGEALADGEAAAETILNSEGN